MLAAIPTPSVSEVSLGPLTVRAYALCILAGIVLAVVLTERRYQARGSEPGVVQEIAVPAVVCGIIGARVYHVLTDLEDYLPPDGDPLQALFIWEGGLGIWGGVAGGAVGVWFALRRRGRPVAPLGDALAPGLVLAQAVGRLGNWFNGELFGRPTDLPWALEVPQGRAGTVPGEDTYHPTFLYEMVWDVGVAAVCVWADRRFRLGGGRVFALYVLLYTVGRGMIETLRVDPAPLVAGLRLNVWTSLLVGLGALVYLLVRRGARRETPEQVRGERDASVGADREDSSTPTGRPDEQHPVTPGSRRAGPGAPGTSTREAPTGSAEGRTPP